MISFKGRHHQQDIILQCVRWYVAYSLSYRDLEELMQERGYAVDHSTIQRWVVHYAPRIEKAFRKNKKRTGLRWYMDETYLKIKGQWKYLYRAVDKQGDTVDFLLTAKRDRKAARRFLNKAMADTAPLKELIARYITEDVIAAIAREHKTGRRLFVGTEFTCQYRSNPLGLTQQNQACLGQRTTCLQQ